MTSPTLPPADRRRYSPWLAAYERTGEGSRNYPRWLGSTITGFVSPRPPTVTPPDADLPGEATSVADLIDEGVELSAALGVVWLRPVNTATGWTLQIIDPSNSTAEWGSRQHGPVTVWSIAAHPRKPAPAALAMIETWPADPDEPVQIEVWEGTRVNETFNGEVQVNVDQPPADLAEHPFITGADTTPRRITPVVTRWDRGRPAPIYVGAETWLTGLDRLNAQEQDDAELARNRIAISEDMLATRPILDPSGRPIAQPGWRKDSNLLVMAPGLSAQAGDDVVKTISFPDSLTQRERIERRENELLEYCGIAPQSLGRSVGGRSDSGAAKRADSQLTVQTAMRLGRSWSTGMTAALREVARLNGRPDWESVEVRCHPGLATSLTERADTVSALRDTGSTSMRQRVETLHPEWTTDQIDAELDAIIAETPTDFLP